MLGAFAVGNSADLYGRWPPAATGCLVPLTGSRQSAWELGRTRLPQREPQVRRRRRQLGPGPCPCPCIGQPSALGVPTD